MERITGGGCWETGRRLPAIAAHHRQALPGGVIQEASFRKGDDFLGARFGSLRSRSFYGGRGGPSYGPDGGNPWPAHRRRASTLYESRQPSL
jgi:hypothetical protein